MLSRYVASRLFLPRVTPYLSFLKKCKKKYKNCRSRCWWNFDKKKEQTKPEFSSRRVKLPKFLTPPSTSSRRKSTPPSPSGGATKKKGQRLPRLSPRSDPKAKKKKTPKKEIKGKIFWQRIFCVLLYTYISMYIRINLHPPNFSRQQSP